MRKVTVAIAASAIVLAAPATGLAAMHRMQNQMQAGEGGMSHHHEMLMRLTMILIDTDGDGALSSEELQAVFGRIFNHVDTNKDGKLTSDEMQAVLRSASPTPDQ